VKLCFVDVETTGLTTRHGVIQIAGIVAYGEPLVVLDRFDYKCRPYDADLIDNAALSVHGYSREKIATFQDPAEALAQFVVMLHRHKRNDKLVLAGYNVSFDHAHVSAWMSKGNEQYGRWFRSIPMDVASMVISYCRLMSLPLPSMRLVDVANMLGVQLLKAHDAAADIAATVDIYKKVT
jgi:DNA polymerase III epsilon subunit-like protein